MMPSGGSIPGKSVFERASSRVNCKSRHDPIDYRRNAVDCGEDNNGHPCNGKIVQPVTHGSCLDDACAKRAYR